MYATSRESQLHIKNAVNTRISENVALLANLKPKL